MPIAHVQTDRFSPAGGATSIAVSLLGVTPGAALIVNLIQYYPFAIVVSSVTDAPKGDTFTLSIESTSGDNPTFARQYIAYNVVGGDTTVTVAMSGSTYLAMFLSEVTGLEPNGLDQVVSQIGTAVTAPSSGNIPSPTVQADELLIALVGRHVNAGTFTAGSGYTIPTNGKIEVAGNAVDAAMEYQIVTTTGTYAATFTLSVADNTNTLLATYKAVATGGLSIVAAEGMTVSDTRRQLG